MTRRAKGDTSAQVKDPVRTKSGRVLSEAEYEALADQAEAGFDLADWKLRRAPKPGGPDSGDGREPGD